MLSTLIALLSASLLHAQVNALWSEGEHLELGDKGALMACFDLGLSAQECPIKNINRADKKIKFSYGEIVTTADHYSTAKEMYLDNGIGIKKVLKCAHKLNEDHPINSPQDPEYNGCDITAFLNVPGYLEVVSNNYGHFGWHNMKAYVRYHENALNKAREAFQKKKTNPRESQELLNQALILNAFADHYLTDGFAAGHIRVPRIQIKSWAASNLTGLFKSLRGDGLAIILHNTESKNLRTGFEAGMPVKNSRGDKWLTRSDQYLHTSQDMFDPAFMQPLTAVKLSFKELLQAWQTGKIPDSTFLATEQIPFSDDLPLAQKLSEKSQGLSTKNMLNAMYAELPFVYSLIFPKSDGEKMLKALPALMLQFRKDIANDLKKEPNLKRRLPHPYLDAHLNIE